MTQSQIPVVPLVNPLTQVDLATLHDSVEQAKQHADIGARLQASGIDVSDHMARNQMHHDVASNLIKHFFPTNLTPPKQEEENGMGDSGS